MLQHPNIRLVGLAIRHWKLNFGFGLGVGGVGGGCIPPLTQQLPHVPKLPSVVDVLRAGAERSERIFNGVGGGVF